MNGIDDLQLKEEWFEIMWLLENMGMKREDDNPMKWEMSIGSDFGGLLGRIGTTCLVDLHSWQATKGGEVLEGYLVFGWIVVCFLHFFICPRPLATSKEVIMLCGKYIVSLSIFLDAL